GCRGRRGEDPGLTTAERERTGRKADGGGGGGHGKTGGGDPAGKKWPQRPLPVRQREKVQEVPRGRQPATFKFRQRERQLPARLSLKAGVSLRLPPVSPLRFETPRPRKNLPPRRSL